MQQQINLYHLLPKPKRQLFSWKMLYAVYGLFLLLLIFQSIYHVWKKDKLQDQYEQELVSLNQSQKRLDELLAKYPSISTQDIQKVRTNLQEQLFDQEKIIEFLARTSIFSAYMQGLAQASVPSAWLTHFVFSADEPHIVLTGNALQAGSAQLFLDQLMQQPVFKPVPFKIDSLVEKKSEQGVIVDFNITTHMQSPK